ncbi:MAG: diguanylate cyclase, partial [Haliscomenobacter sp.]|nr:diguanylate cyclase [Haliscomenobacter sp.]
QISDYPAEAGWWARRLSDLRHMALPMFCLTYGSLAFIALQMRNAMVETLQQDYIRLPGPKD